MRKCMRVSNIVRYVCKELEIFIRLIKELQIFIRVNSYRDIKMDRSWMREPTRCSDRW